LHRFTGDHLILSRLYFAGIVSCRDISQNTPYGATSRRNPRLWLDYKISSCCWGY